MQTEGFISEFLLLDFSYQRIPTNQPRFNAGGAYFSFDFGVNYSWKGYHNPGFVIRLVLVLPHLNVSKSKVGDRSRGRPEGSLFNSYHTEV